MNISPINAISQNQRPFNNTNFKANKIATGVFNRSAEEIENIVSWTIERLDGRNKFTIAEQLCDMVGKCLGNKYLFELIDGGKEPGLWLAIKKKPKEAMEVIVRILKDGESQGKTYNEIVDKMITELEPKKKLTKMYA